MRVKKNGQPNEPLERIPLILQCFYYGRQLTANQLAVGFGIPLGANAVKLCRKLGLPLQSAGFVEGRKLSKKLYALDLATLWRALEEAIRQIDRYVLILQSKDPSKNRRTYRTVGKWMQHVYRIENLKRNKPGQKHGSLHKKRATSHG